RSLTISRQDRGAAQLAATRSLRRRSSHAIPPRHDEGQCRTSGSSARPMLGLHACGCSPALVARSTTAKVGAGSVEPDTESAALTPDAGALGPDTETLVSNV